MSTSLLETLSRSLVPFSRIGQIILKYVANIWGIMKSFTQSTNIDKELDVVPTLASLDTQCTKIVLSSAKQELSFCQKMYN